MKFFLDSAIVDEVKFALEYFDIDGVTTNPRHVQVSGKPFMTVIREIADLVEGTDKTISVEVNPHYTEFDDIVGEARKLAGISPNFVIKLQCMESTLKAIPVLAKEGVRVNFTLVFSPVQALYAMRAGAFYDPEPAADSPDNFYGVSCGSGITFRGESKKELFALDFFYQFRFGEKRNADTMQGESITNKIKEHYCYTSIIYYLF